MAFVDTIGKIFPFKWRRKGRMPSSSFCGFFDNIAELRAASGKLAENKVYGIRSVHPIGLIRAGSRGRTHEKGCLREKSLVIHICPPRMDGHATEDSSPDRDSCAFRDIARTNGVLVSKSSAVFPQNGRGGDSGCAQDVTHEIAFAGKHACIVSPAGNLAGKRIKATGPSAAGEKKRRVLLLPQRSGLLCRLSMPAARNKDHVSGLRRIIQKDVLTDIMKPIMHISSPESKVRPEYLSHTKNAEEGREAACPQGEA